MTNFMFLVSSQGLQYSVSKIQGTLLHRWNKQGIKPKF